MMLLAGRKEIAEFLRSMQIPMEERSVDWFAGLADDPLPVLNRRRLGARSGRVYANPDEVRQWAMRRLELTRREPG